MDTIPNVTILTKSGYESRIEIDSAFLSQLPRSAEIHTENYENNRIPIYGETDLIYPVELYNSANQLNQILSTFNQNNGEYFITSLISEERTKNLLTNAASEESSFTLNLELFEKFNVKKSVVNENKFGTTFIGTVDDDGIVNLFLDKENNLSGTIISNDGEFDIIPLEGGQQLIVEVVDSDEMHPNIFKDEIDRSVLMEAEEFDESEIIFIDVIVAYTDAVFALAKNTIEKKIRRMILEANSAFSNSGLDNVELRLVHTFKTDFQSNEWAKCRDEWPKEDKVKNIRDRYMGDIMILVINNNSKRGLTKQIYAAKENAYIFMNYRYMSRSYTFPHEVGHVLGARHDKCSLNVNSNDSNHGYINDSWRVMTLMSTSNCCGCLRFNEWSNPQTPYKNFFLGSVRDANNIKLVKNRIKEVASFY
ncbi:MAG: hypothetical protein HKN09_05260 [Saprospiraceae bacterium]|nr:hypothetical protein [Saprospiraceae bacterium]